MSLKRPELESAIVEDVIEVVAHSEQPRIDDLKLLRRVLEIATTTYIDDWGMLPHVIEDECGYDLGAIKGLQMAISAIETTVVSDSHRPTIH